MLLLRLVTDERADIAARLRGAAVDVCDDLARCHESLTNCQALVFAGSVPVRLDTVERLLDAGKHILLVTDPHLSLPEMVALAERANAKGVRFSVVNPDRYLPSRRLIREHLGSKLGAAGLVRIHRWEPASSGPLLRRDLDLALWLAGESPNIVYAVGEGDGSFALAHLGFSGGGMALIDHDRRLPKGDGYLSFSVIGFSGAAYADDHQNMQLAFHGGAPQAIPTGEGPRALAAMVQEFVDAIAGGDVGFDLTSWRNVFRVADAVGESLLSRRAVVLEGALS